MPIYEYRCRCGNKVEILTFSPTEVLTCIKCGKKMEKQISAPIAIKGCPTIKG